MYLPSGHWPLQAFTDPTTKSQPSRLKIRKWKLNKDFRWTSAVPVPLMNEFAYIEFCGRPWTSRGYSRWHARLGKSWAWAELSTTKKGYYGLPSSLILSSCLLRAIVIGGMIGASEMSWSQRNTDLTYVCRVVQFLDGEMERCVRCR